MSSPKPAAKAASGKIKAPPATGRKAKAADSATPSAQALRLAAEMEHGVTDGRLDVVSDEARQRLMAALCKTYSQQVQSGAQSLPLKMHSVTPTDVMITASALLRAADLQVFELGMWQSWTGR